MRRSIRSGQVRVVCVGKQPVFVDYLCGRRLCGRRLCGRRLCGRHSAWAHGARFGNAHAEQNGMAPCGLWHLLTARCLSWLGRQSRLAFFSCDFYLSLGGLSGVGSSRLLGLVGRDRFIGSGHWGFTLVGELAGRFNRLGFCDFGF